jgi:hypothetical protein
MQLPEWKHTTCVHLVTNTISHKTSQRVTPVPITHTQASILPAQRNKTGALHGILRHMRNCHELIHTILSDCTLPYTSMMRQLSCDVWSRCTNMVSKWVNTLNLINNNIALHGLVQVYHWTKQPNYNNPEVNVQYRIPTASPFPIVPTP